MRSKEEIRDLMRQRIREENWSDLFLGGACFFFAVVLHDELHLPLFYATPTYSDEFRHVFVMDKKECIDFLGRHTVETIAKRYAEWADVPPKPTTKAQVIAKIKDNQLGDDLEEQLFRIARAEFVRDKAKYS